MRLGISQAHIAAAQVIDEQYLWPAIQFSLHRHHRSTHRLTYTLGFHASSVELFLPFCKVKPTKQLHFKRLTNHISLLSFLLCFSSSTTCCCCWCCWCNQCHCHGNLHTHKMQHKTTKPNNINNNFFNRRRWWRPMTTTCCLGPLLNYNLALNCQ